MSWSQRSLRAMASLALAAALAGPVTSAGAAGFERMGQNRWEAPSFVESLWTWARSAFSPDIVPTAACGGDRGAGLDPNGCGSTGSGGDSGGGGGAVPPHH
jgi:hypothetical protein